MQDTRTFQWHASTRKFLGGADGIARIQEILRGLIPKVLEETLYDWAEDLPWFRRKKLCLSEPGALFRLVQSERERLRPIFERYNRKLGPLIRGGTLPERDTGAIHVVSRDESHSVAFGYDEFGVLPRANELRNFLSIVRYRQAVPERSEDLTSLADYICRNVLSNDLFEWTYCCIGEEYEANNMDFGGGGARALGRDFSKTLPGFYWGNYFGPFLIDTLGPAKFASVPGCKVERLGPGIFVSNELPPDEWQSAEYQRNRIAAMEHLGRHFFFEKGKEMTGSLFPVQSPR